MRLLTLRNFQFFELHMTSFWWVVPPQSQFKQWNFLRCYLYLTHLPILETFSKKFALSPILNLGPWNLVRIPKKCQRAIFHHPELRVMTVSYLKKLTNTKNVVFQGFESLPADIFFWKFYHKILLIFLNHNEFSELRHGT